MKERIKKIRIDSGLSQTDFAKKLSVSRSAICKMESGENNPSDQTIDILCGKFSVNKDWLRTGFGEPYIPTQDERSAYVSDLLEGKDDEFCDLIIGIMKTYSDLSEKEKSILRVFSKKLLENLKGRD